MSNFSLIIAKINKRLRQPLATAKEVSLTCGRLVNEQLWQRCLSPWRRGVVAMFHVGRSGSTVLGSMLGQNPRVRWEGEIYEYHLLKLDRWSVIPAPGCLDAERILLNRLHVAGNRFYGFEVKPFHLHMAGMGIERFVHRAQDIPIDHYIVLERKNHLRVIVSSLIAHAKSVWFITNGKQPRLQQIALDPDGVEIDRSCRPLVELLNLYEQNFRDLRHALQGKDCLELTYEEDLAEDPTVGYRKVCDYLGIEDAPSRIKFSRTNPWRLSEILTNYDEVKSALQQTPYAWMLEA
jgi:hypothetical protein